MNIISVINYLFLFLFSLFILNWIVLSSNDWCSTYNMKEAAIVYSVYKYNVCIKTC